ncbi:immunoglobulin-like domain-containing protein [Paenibacillus solani]|uniref:immunoglobulin-like domain-containing protein n=1 Tax=Paenibacillus solani TaxID=1705565 RepID=UPI003D2D33EA
MRKLVVIMAFGLVLLGCESKSNLPEVKAPSVHMDATVAHLTDTIGNPDKVSISVKLPQEKVLSAAKDYHPTTGKWFDAKNGYNLIVSSTAEEVEAGSRVGASIEKIPAERSARFQITSRDTEGERVQLITEYTADINNSIDGRLDFSYKIPEHPNTNYFLSIEILSPQGDVEDTMISRIFVPSNELNARLTVKEPLQSSNQTELTLYNAGPTDLYFGYGYSIYQKVTEGWKLLPDDSAVPSIAFQLKPGESHEEGVSFPQKLEPGVYRIVKQIEGYMTDVSARLAAEFEIKDTDGS